MNAWLLAKAAFGILAALAYIFTRSRAGKASERETGNLINAFLAGTGAIAGVKLCLFIFNNEFLILASKQEVDVLSVLAGGIALTYLSCVAILSLLKQKPRGEKDST